MKHPIRVRNQTRKHIIIGEAIPVSSHDIDRGKGAADGSRRLLTAICMYHMNRTTGRVRENWRQIGLEASFDRHR